MFKIIRELFGFSSAVAATAAVVLHTDVQPGYKPWRSVREDWQQQPPLTYYAPRGGVVEPEEEPVDEVDLLASLSRDAYWKLVRYTRQGYFQHTRAFLVAA